MSDRTDTILSAQIFYQGSGKLCAVVDIKDQSLPVHHPGQSYACEGSSYLDDPFEGELFTWWLQFFGGLSDLEIENLWTFKRAKLESVDYHMGKYGPITVQKGELFSVSGRNHAALMSIRIGYWFSSHETWKVMEMPYYDVDIIR